MSAGEREGSGQDEARGASKDLHEHGQAAHRSHWRVGGKREVANGWAAGLGRPGEGTWWQRTACVWEREREREGVYVSVCVCG